MREVSESFCVDDYLGYNSYNLFYRYNTNIHTIVNMELMNLLVFSLTPCSRK